jgi:hypothetical protein
MRRIDIDRMTKGALIKAIFQDDWVQVDPAFPVGLDVDNPYFFVMDYSNSILGRFVDLRTLAELYCNNEFQVPLISE